MTLYRETAAIRAIKGYTEALNAAVQLEKAESVAENEGKLVLVSGAIQKQATQQHVDGGHDKLQDGADVGTFSSFVYDPAFGIAVRGVELERKVEMLQWVETTHVSSSGTAVDDVDSVRSDEERDRTYLYDLRWRDEPVNSLSFYEMSYQNPTADAWLVKKAVIKPSHELVIGDFRLSQELINQIERKDRVQLQPEQRRAMQRLLEREFGAEGRDDAAILPNDAVVEDDYVYLLQHAPTHSLGDIRVSFYVKPPYAVTVCGKQQGREIVPFKTEAAYDILLLCDGIHSVDSLFEAKTSKQIHALWVSRAFAAVLGFVGFNVLYNQPLFAALARYRTHQQRQCVASHSVSMVFSSVGLCWALYRPLLAVGCWAVTGIAALVANKYSHPRRSTVDEKND
ncbi:TPA: hypothetical protein N0F65_008362 [Lagenidium giganteum]|uniref:Transmembrane protein n=1 Tax=Lagenidium giganteum TaxID=4803 RepID=A0AAV2YQX8_9STRA|nr:TPA: hypothetical protein N0F65_008362 [Lagenidium giganteum]